MAKSSKDTILYLIVGVFGIIFGIFGSVYFFFKENWLTSSIFFLVTLIGIISLAQVFGD
ncbi:MAG: hypothetical protein ISS82_01530 [Nanoarchaeota archaeon]|nr:hypothetical protein [Nanoarchaeota archaeon]